MNPVLRSAYRPLESGMERYPAEAGAPVLVLAHGAGAGEKHPWMLRVARGLADRGVSVVTFEFPYMQSRRSGRTRAPILEAAYRAVWEEVTRERAGRNARFFAGGKSMGGRIASQVAAANGFAPRAAGLVFFGYPLHPPDAPAKRRDAHLPRIAAPMLFIHGTRDPFGNPDEMQRARRDIANSSQLAAHRRRRSLTSAVEAVGVGGRRGGDCCDVDLKT